MIQSIKMMTLQKSACVMSYKNLGNVKPMEIQIKTAIFWCQKKNISKLFEEIPSHDYTSIINKYWWQIRLYIYYKYLWINEMFLRSQNLNITSNIYSFLPSSCEKIPKKFASLIKNVSKCKKPFSYNRELSRSLLTSCFWVVFANGCSLYLTHTGDSPNRHIRIRHVRPLRAG